MRLFTYIVMHDLGFAPNPFFEICTLACCKPKIRETAEVGDWVVGLTPKRLGNKLVYAMRVTEKLRFEDYWQDPRFACKKPDVCSGKLVDQRGDNIYQPLTEQPLGDNDYEQQEALHKQVHKKRDLSSHFVLVSHDYCYFGSQAEELPYDLNYLLVSRGHRCRFTPEQIASAVSFLEGFKRGVNAAPRKKWPDDDTSWVDTMRTGTI